MPETTITLTYTEDGFAREAFDVTLENPDNTFGIIDLTTGEVVIEAGMATDDPSADPSATLSIDSPSLGVYNFTFTSTVGHTYLVAWKITPSEGEPPVYKIEQVEAFYSITDETVSAISDQRGIFRQGTLATLFLKVTDFNGNPTNAETITVKIYDENGSLVVLDETVPERPANGFYVFDWDIDDTQTPGKYTVLWVYKVEGITDTEVQEVVISEDAEDTLYYSTRLNDFRIALNYHINCAQGIPVYYEQSKTSRDRKKFEFTFPRWNQSAGVRIYRNKELINTGLEINYFKGTVTFGTTLIPQDMVHADYNFRWFSDEDLDRFLHNAVQTVNIFPPASIYTLDNVPDRYVPAILYGATKDALRQLMLCLQFQEPQQVFGGREGSEKAFSNFETLKENYTKDWEKFLEQKKYGPFPRTHTIVTPSHTLPGGRSLDKTTSIVVIVTAVNKEVTNCSHYDTGMNIYTNTYNFNDNVYTNTCLVEKDVEIQTLTLEEVYKLFREGYSIEVLSHNDISGNLIFVPVNYVWESGLKDVYELRTNNGYSIRSSDEHLFYINGKYIPLRDIKVGDEVITSDNHSVEESGVKSIKQLKGKGEMLDLEVFGTANLFANGIKCHNSRWFRMLFKS